MANTPGATAPNPPPNRVNAAPKLKSTPNAVGSAVISEHISSVGVNVDDIRPWIARDVENFRQCGADTTAKIRRALGMDDADQGSRVLYIIVVKKLLPITTLSGVEFLMAWWEVVRCHYALWKKGVHHRDISPSNIMVYKTSDGRFIGVLNDYDLSSTQCTPRGNERTGTVPFMAINLLTPEAIAGKVEHLYRHDAESLVWVLVWVCVRYEGGKLLSQGRPLDNWSKADANACREKKSAFVLMSQGEDLPVTPTLSHLSNWNIALSLLDCVLAAFSRRAKVLDDRSVFETWFEANVKSSLPT